MAKPTVLVLGATGQQGGSVAYHLIESKQYNVRALVRNPNKNSAIKLKKAGIQLIKGDLSKPETLKNILNNVTYLFINTCWDLMTETEQHEIDRGKNIINCINIKSLSLKHVIYSSIPNLKGNKEAKPKQIIEKLLKNKLSNNINIKYTIIYPTFFYENFLSVWPLFRHLISRKLYWCMLPLDNNKLIMQSIAIEDLGGIILGLLNNKIYINKNNSLIAVSDIVYLSDILLIFSDVLDEEILFEPLSMDQFNCLPFPKSVIDGLKYYRNMNENDENINKFITQGKNDLKICKELYKNIQNTKQWAIKHKNELLGNYNKDNDPDGKRSQMKMGILLYKRYAVIKEFVSRPIVTVSILGIGIGIGYGFYYWRNK